MKKRAFDFLMMLALTASRALAGEPIALPAPDGPHAVGTTVWHMTDRSREEPMTEAAWDRRELMVQAWYPTADDSTDRAPYAPVTAGVGHRTTHAIPAAPLDPTPGQIAIIMIAPGRGTPGFQYTALAESLASHGYIAVAVDSPHSGQVFFPDGKVVPPSPEYRPPPGLFAGPYAQVDAFYEPAAQAGGADLSFVLDELIKLHRNDPSGRFTGRLDIDRVGVFGHSLGGRIAGAAVAADRRFKAYLSMEGVAPRRARREGLDAVAAILLTAEVYPHAIANVKELVPKRRDDVFIIRLEKFGHNSVTDRPLLEGGLGYDVDPLEAMALTREMARRFFDRYLRDRPERFDDSTIWPPSVHFESFPYRRQ